LLDNLFSFLRRKTDFYTGASTQQIEELVIKVVQKQASVHQKEEAEKKKQKEREEALKKKKAEEKKKKEDEERKKKEEEARAKETKPPAAPAVEEEILELAEDGSFDTAKAKSVSASSSSSSAEKSLEKEPSENSMEGKLDDEKDEKEEEEDKTPPRKPPITRVFCDLPFFLFLMYSIAPGNGGSTDTYSWTQTLSELTVIVKVPTGTTSRMVTVDIRNNHLKVKNMYISRY
jgi:chemotaxis protein histidine kinase CheA